MPYFIINGKSVYDRLREPKFHFLVFSNRETDFNELPGQTEKHGERIDFQTFPLTPQVAEIFGASESLVVLLRPDNHIGFVSEKITMDILMRFPFLQKSFDSN